MSGKQAVYVSLAPEQGSAEERALVASLADTSRGAMLARLFDAASEMELDANVLSEARPDASRTGMSIKATLLHAHAIKCSDGKMMTMCDVVLSGPLSVALQAQDTDKNGASCLSFDGDEARAWARVDTRYAMCEMDRKLIEADRGSKLPANRTNGVVSLGVTPLFANQILTISLYNVAALESAGRAITPGAMLQFNSVQFDVQWKDGAAADRLSVRAGDYKVLKNDAENRTRFDRCADESNIVPPLDQTTVLEHSTVMEWPKDMLLNRELPAASRGNGLQTESAPMRSNAPPAITDGSQPSGGGVAPPRLLVPEHPKVFYNFGAPFVAHVGESQAQTQARFSDPESRGFPTLFLRPVLSTDEDALTYEDQNKKKCVRAKFELVALQQIADRQVKAVIHCTVPKDGPVQMLTGTVATAAQEMVLPAIIACMQGPLVLELKTAGEHEFPINELEGAVNLSSYVSVIPPLVLPLTVPRAGIQVSHAFVIGEMALRASLDLRTEMQIVAAACEYHRVAGPPSTQSKVMLLNQCIMGCFDDASNTKLHARLERMRAKPKSEQRAAIKDLLGDLTGEVTTLGTTHDFFVVGRFVPSPVVMQHQNALRAENIDALLRGNEQLLLEGILPESYPREAYTTCNALARTSELTLIYAVAKTGSSGSFIQERMKRQLESAGVLVSKRKTAASRDEEVD